MKIIDDDILTEKWMIFIQSLIIFGSNFRGIFFHLHPHITTRDGGICIQPSDKFRTENL